MENPNSTAVGQWLSNKLSGQPNQPLTGPALAFARKMLPMLGVTTMPDATATTTMTNPTPDETTLSGRAESRMRYEGTKQQQNLEDISFGALPFINEKAKPDEIDEDWLANFYDKSRLVSDREMHKLWSHVLSSEVNQPGGFSIRTVNLLASLNSHEAELFKRVCAFGWIDEESDNDNSLTLIVPDEMIGTSKKDKFTVRDFYNLQDIGLVNYESNAAIQFAIGTNGGAPLVLSYHGKRFEINSLGEKNEPLKGLLNGLAVGQAKLSYSGRELSRICTPEPNFEYMNDILAFFKKQRIVAAAL